MTFELNRCGRQIGLKGILGLSTVCRWVYSRSNQPGGRGEQNAGSGYPRQPPDRGLCLRRDSRPNPGNRQQYVLARSGGHHDNCGAGGGADTKDQKEAMNSERQ